VAVTAAAIASRAVATRRRDTPMFYRETVLDNGVTVLTESLDSVRSVALGVWFSVGSRDESPR
jgi:predicted Zn-dependent peptidase